MTTSNIPDDDLTNWNTGEDGAAEKFIVSATGRTARKYLGSYDDAQEVIEWVEASGGSAELEDTDQEMKTVHVSNPADGSVVELQPLWYLVLEDGRFSTDPASVYEGDEWDGVADLPSE